jgi:hypothetical protein
VGYGYLGYAALGLGWLLVLPLQLRILQWIEQSEEPPYAA